MRLDGTGIQVNHETYRLHMTCFQETRQALFSAPWIEASPFCLLQLKTSKKPFLQFLALICCVFV